MKTCGLVIFFTMALVLVAMSSAEITYECTEPNDCHYAYTCHKNQCVHACGLRNSNELGNKCGPNAACMTREPHSAVCGCQPDHIGDPNVECVKVSHAEYLADLKKRNRQVRN